MTELLPCPFCGGSEPYQYKGTSQVGCDNCCYSIQRNKWNTRAASPSEWQPIESAPKDATWILIWDADYNKSYIARCTTDGMATSGDWDYEHKRATHWMNLPKPPRSLK